MSQLTASLFCFYTESPLHVGSSTGLGAIDLPLQRERFTQLPLIPGSALKGALREQAAERAGTDKEDRVYDLFGPPPPESNSAEATDDDTAQTKNEDSTNAQGRKKNAKKDKRKPQPSEFAGAIGVGDGRLLLLPVRSARAGWAWLTCPLCLQRLARDLEILGQEPPIWADLAVDEELVLAPANSRVAVWSEDTKTGDLIIEDLQFKVQDPAASDRKLQALGDWLQNALPNTPAYRPYRERLPSQLVVMSDTDFTDLAEHVTEIHTRVRLTDNRTVQKGGLWTEETLPPETLLWSLVFFDRQRRFPQNGEKRATSEEMRNRLRELYGWPRDNSTHSLRPLRLGGDLTVGRGLIALTEVSQ